MLNLPVKNKLENELFRIKPMKPVVKTTAPHGHKNYLEIIYLQEGMGTHQIDHQRYTITPSTVYFVMPGQLHHWELTSVPKGFVVMLQKNFLPDHPLFNLFFDTFPPLFANAITLREMEVTVLNIFNAIQLEHEQQYPNCEAIIQSYLLLLFNLLRRATASEAPLVYPSSLTRFFDTIETHLTGKQSVRWFAEKLGISSKSLNLLCREYIGKTAGQIIADRVTREARRQLLYTTDSLSEIAYRLGFSDLSHFNKFFKRQTGLLPGPYRRSIA